MTCDMCKHFNTSEHYNRDEGWCDLDLPPWVYAAANINKHEVPRQIKTDDTCSFFKGWKE